LHAGELEPGELEQRRRPAPGELVAGKLVAGELVDRRLDREPGDVRRPRARELEPGELVGCRAPGCEGGMHRARSDTRKLEPRELGARETGEQLRQVTQITDPPRKRAPLVRAPVSLHIEPWLRRLRAPAGALRATECRASGKRRADAIRPS